MIAIFFSRDDGDSIVNTRHVLEEMDLLLIATPEDIVLVREVCELMSQRGAYVVATGIKTKHFGSRPRGYKTFSMLNSTEHEIYPAHKC